MHVATPLAVAKRSTLPQVKDFAHDVCLQMTRDIRAYT
jgi:DNA primase